MFIATQYYRPPFPEQRYWKDDFARIRDAGLDAVQLWACWGWIESEPGVFRFDDYDELIAGAGRQGLGVVISTIAEIQPFWIHRLEPDAHMVDHMGHRVISSLRAECNVGLTPGGCTDHPAIRERMEVFLHKMAQRYAGLDHLRGWDCWNENRWCVQADGYVCYCPHTLSAFRDWLKERYGGLDKLNKAWKRRYCRWEDVFPGKLPGRPYTDMMEFLRFLTWRSYQQARFRYEAIRSHDKSHIITLHPSGPSIMSCGGEFEQTLCRGNDWDMAKSLDGLGCSHFPFSGREAEDAEFGLRLESIRSAAQGKVVWVSELQGGSVRSGHDASFSVPAADQQRWVWNSVSRGAKAVVFWCWRDEVFGRESSGHGLIGLDGLAEERIRAMKKTGAVLEKYQNLLDEYAPDVPKVGVIFNPDNYYLDWAQYGKSDRAAFSVQGYALALERLQIPYEIVESYHPDMLDRLKAVFLPWSLIVPQETAKCLERFVRNGGTLFCEAETDSFSPEGFYRYPGEDRDLMNTFGVSDRGRRIVDEASICVSIGDASLSLKAEGFFTPLEAKDAEVLAHSETHGALLIRKSLGKGQIYVLGSFAGIPYQRERYPDFEELIKHVVSQAGTMPELQIEPHSDMILWRAGKSGKQRLLFIMNSGERKEVNIIAPQSYFSGQEADDLVAGNRIPVSFRDNQGNRGRFRLILETGSFNLYRF